MAIPTSGQIGVSQHLNRELGRGINDTFSIDTAENGGYGTINPFSRSRPSATNPASFSEWYGYDHGGGGPGPIGGLVLDMGYSSDVGDEGAGNACAGFQGLTIYAENEERRWWNQSIYRNNSYTIFAIRGWYSDQPNEGGYTVRYWGGSSWATEASLCTI